MSAETDALHQAEVALEQAKAAIVAAEHVSEPVAPAEPVKPSEGSVYLGHIGEAAVKGMDY